MVFGFIQSPNLTPSHQAPASRAPPRSAAPFWVQVNLSAPGRRIYNKTKDKGSRLKPTTNHLRLLATDHVALRSALERQLCGVDCDFHPDQETLEEDGVVGLSKEALIDSFQNWDRVGPRLTAVGYKLNADSEGRTTLVLYAKITEKSSRASTSSVRVDKDERCSAGVSNATEQNESSLKKRAEAFDVVVGLWPRDAGCPYSWNSKEVPKWVRDMILQSYRKALRDLVFQFQTWRMT